MRGSESSSPVTLGEAAAISILIPMRGSEIRLQSRGWGTDQKILIPMRGSEASLPSGARCWLFRGILIPMRGSELQRRRRGCARRWRDPDPHEG